MAIGGLGPWEIIAILVVLLLTFGVPIVVIVVLVIFLKKRTDSSRGMKKCAFCGYSIPVGATFCGICGKELPH